MSGDVSTSQDVDRSRTAAVNTDAALAAQLQAKEDHGQSKNESLVKNAAASPMDQAQLLQSDDDDSEDDVDWEDGYDMQIDEPPGQRFDVQVLDRIAGPSLNAQMGINDDDSDDAVDWEDGDRGGANGVARLSCEEWNPLDQGVSQAVTRSGSQDGAAVKKSLGEAALHSSACRLKHVRQDEDDEMQAMFKEQTSDNGLENDFDKAQHVDATAAALEHAQATASILTEWDGLAFCRAVQKRQKKLDGQCRITEARVRKKNMKVCMSNGQIFSKSEIEEPVSTTVLTKRGSREKETLQCLRGLE